MEILRVENLTKIYGKEQNQLIAIDEFTYEQILSSQAEQVATKANNVDTIPDIGKILLKNSEIEDEDKKFHVV